MRGEKKKEKKQDVLTKKCQIIWQHHIYSPEYMWYKLRLIEIIIITNDYE